MKPAVFLPANWSMYYPTPIDVMMFLGTWGVFGSAFALFLKVLPAVAISEIKELNHEINHHAHHGEQGHSIEGNVAPAGGH